MRRRAHVFVSGRVQGVCYRMYACEEAERLGITGWVRNLHDGKVEIVAEGEEASLDKFVEWCRLGSPHARVTDVRTEYSESTGEFDEFGTSY
jgi:acylphosphatase